MKKSKYIKHLRLHGIILDKDFFVFDWGIVFKDGIDTKAGFVRYIEGQDVIDNEFIIK